MNVLQMETESRVSNSSSSNHVSGSGSAAVDEWDEVLRSINADPAVPTQYKVMFRLFSLRFITKTVNFCSSPETSVALGAL